MRKLTTCRMCASPIATAVAILATNILPIHADDAVLPNTKPLVGKSDIADQLVAGADTFLLKQLEASIESRGKFWKRDLSSADAYNKSIEPNRERLKFILGVRDSRIAFDSPELVGTISRPARVASADNYDVIAIRWPAFGNVHGEGLLLEPKNGKPIANVVVIPDCGQSPEQCATLLPGVTIDSQYARRLAASGCRVVLPRLINRDERSKGITNREWIYRSAFELGRGMIGYELQKILAIVDWFDQSSGGARRIGVIGWSEGGLLALYAGAIDPRIDCVCVSGYFDSRQRIWQEPIDRNIFGLLNEFGDAELASMIAPRRLIIEAARVREEAFSGGNGAPGRVLTPNLTSVRAEVARAQTLVQGLRVPHSIELQVSGDDGRGPSATTNTLATFLGTLAPNQTLESKDGLHSAPTPPNAAERHARQLDELDRHNQFLLRESQYVRKAWFWDRLKYDSLQSYEASIEPFRKYFADEVIGRFDIKPLPANARTRRIDANDRWTRYEVVLDVFPDVFAYGLLTLPRDIKSGETRPVVVCQHGLEGRPQDTIGEPSYAYYKAFSTKLAEQGFITFAPQNLYIFRDRFRTLQRKANPLKKTLFSAIVPQHQQIVNWLGSLPQVDPKRIAFYGLSYGGKTAMRVPPLVKGYSLSICSGDFNEWVDKNASTRNPRSYMHTPEYEIFEFNLGETFNYAEMAALIAPRPFMVERGHLDQVADDETVAWEYSKVRRLYDAGLKLPQNTEIEWFVGPHTINGKGTVEFLRRHLNWPTNKERRVSFSTFGDDPVTSISTRK
jgi:dienelactone hydrolase